MSTDPPVVRVAPVMGTMASVHVHGRHDPTMVERALDGLFAELERLEQIFSTYRPSSEISQLNRGELSLDGCSAEVVEVLDACTFLEHASSGAFSARRRDDPARLDPAGFVKGWAAERASGVLGAAGLDDWFLNVGGDIQTSGHPAPGAPWRVGVSHPVRKDALVATIPVDGRGAVATSGTAERGAHLHSNRELDDALLAVTVTGPALTWADAYATTVFALGGADGLDWLAQFPGYEGFALWADGRLDHTAGFPGEFFGTSQ